MTYLQEIDLVKLSTTKDEENSAMFVVEPLLPGYGTTLGNTFRRVILSSLKGAAITAVKINDATHEFTTVKGVTEDVVNIILNLKGLRIKYDGDEPTLIKLEAKGPKTVTGEDFKASAEVEIKNKKHVIANIEKNSKLSIIARVESGKGYQPTEAQAEDSIPVDMIAVDAIFTPIKKINYTVSNTRVGKITNYDKLEFSITTDGTLTPEEAFIAGNEIITQYVGIINSQIKVKNKKIKKS